MNSETEDFVPSALLLFPFFFSFLLLPYCFTVVWRFVFDLLRFRFYFVFFFYYCFLRWRRLCQAWLIRTSCDSFRCLQIIFRGYCDSTLDFVCSFLSNLCCLFKRKFRKKNWIFIFLEEEHDDFVADSSNISRKEKRSDPAIYFHRYENIVNLALRTKE